MQTGDTCNQPPEFGFGRFVLPGKEFNGSGEQREG
ncbi:Uncharacterised protein [Mycolicibacterium fortuitum]|uniref:Uncharacterized protein n=1 Tax=Mycolicibacterium fortuitum TaxID=1766 RepID=A0A378V1L7_MYCFO|nr:Uncharacterised protein [Mycolicibacterium fortuitum]